MCNDTTTTLSRLTTLTGYPGQDGQGEVVGVELFEAGRAGPEVFELAVRIKL
jgi:hypothetical protein